MVTSTPVNYSSDERALKKFVKQMIRNHYFVGTYLEKRYVPHLNCYKKIIKISNNEEIFMENLTIIKRRLEGFYQNSKWIGITTADTTGAPVGYNIWVDIEEEILGSYKFCVRDVIFTKKEVTLKLGIIEFNKEIKNFNLSSSNKSNSSFFNSFDISSEDDNTPLLSWNNFKNSLIFSFLLILTLLTAGGQIVKYLLDYILKLIEVLTPIIIALLNTISKMFGYICFMILFLWKGGNGQHKFNTFQNEQRIYYQPAYPYANRYKALPYREKSSVVITELEE